jgi:predicted metal-dependent phosphoesterase TrpH
MIDMHTHTTNSDGELSVKELLTLAEENDLSFLSITDHNNIEAYKELDKTRNIFSGKIIPGVELEFANSGILMDMLGYGINFEKIRNTEIMIKGLVHSTIEGETKSLEFYKSICDKLGMKYENNLLIPKPNFMGNDVIADSIIKFKENEEILHRLGITDRTTFYRNHVLNRESPFFVDLTVNKFDISYVSNVIREAGGKCFIAHVFVYNLDNTEKFLDNIVSLKLIDGIECYHRKHTEEQINYLANYCGKHGLLKSGGSDFHKESHSIGHANNGGVAIEEEVVKEWINDIISI